MTSRITYPGDGTLYAIPFPYLDLTHVKVKVDNVELATDAYSFPTSGTVQLDTDPGAANVMVYRETPEEPLTVYQTGSVLSRGDLETDSLQALYRIEEMRDSIPGFPIATPLAPLVWDADGIDLENGSTDLTGDMLLRDHLASTDEGRGAELVGWISVLAQAVARELTAKLNDFEPTPEDFGAVGDGVTDDTTAVLDALDSGRVVNGHGRTYAVSGNIEPPVGFKGLRNIRLSQLTPTGAARRTLYIDGKSDFVLDRVGVLRNGDGSEHTTSAEMADNAGIYLSGCTDFTADFLEASGGGTGTGIALLNCSGFTATRPYAHDMAYALGSDPGDDRIQGIWIDGCSDFTMMKPTAWDLGGDFGGGATNRYTRGIALGGCSMFDIYAPNVNRVDQGFDLTGSAGNRFGTVHGGKAQNCHYYGFKAANSQRWVTIIGAVAQDCGSAGFVVSGQLEVSNPQPHDLKFVACTAHNTGSNGLAGTKAGFLVLSDPIVDASYPRGVKFVQCRAVDDQDIPTMQYGFLNQVVNTGFAQTNETIGCYSEGHTVAAMEGFHKPDVRLEPDVNQSIPNATVTSVNWATEIYDSSGMHSTTSNIDQITIRESGTYTIVASLQYDANVTGRRGARVLVNGVLAAGANNLIPAAASGVTTVPINVIAELNAGDNITIGAYQDSGGPLNVLAIGCAVAVSRIREE